ncbi:class I SAM-dependent methyltransferase [Castellaniella sp. FW104-16D08]|uniref:class I SAM-dependent methyltransferase n=1 Tax=unclassified Castellaniella TaxID=2617606 RepID=UPI0033154D6F
MGTNLQNNERIATACVCCGSKELSSAPAVLMPFVAHRALGWPPVFIDESWGLNTVKKGYAYTICRSLHCNHCGFLFLDIRFSDREMSNLYGGYRDEEYVRLREFYEPGYRLRNEELKKRAGYLVIVDDFIKLHLSCDHPPPRVLDWGGGTGCNSPLAAIRSKLDIYDISGDDPISGAYAVTLAQAQNCEYDLVSCCQVLEHVPYPADILQRIMTCMSDSTLLYIDVPFEGIMNNPEKCMIQKRHWHEHINFYSVESIRKLLDSVGLSLIGVDVRVERVGESKISLLQVVARKI